MSGVSGENAPTPASRRSQGAAGGQGGATNIAELQLLRKPPPDTGQHQVNVRQLLSSGSSLQQLPVVSVATTQTTTSASQTATSTQTVNQQQQQSSVLVNYAALFPQQQSSRTNAAIAGGAGSTDGGTIIRTHSGGANVFVSPPPSSNSASGGDISDNNSVFVNKSVALLPSRFKMNVKSAALRPCDIADIADRLSGNVPTLKRSYSSTDCIEDDGQHLTTPRSFSENQVASVVESTEQVTRKRLKLSEPDYSMIDIDIKILVKKIEEQNLIYLQKIRQEYNRDLMELYYLTMDGNIMDLYAWSKSSKTHTSSYLQFVESHRIITKSEDIEPSIVNKTSFGIVSQTSQNDQCRTSSPVPINKGMKADLDTLSPCIDSTVVQLRAVTDIDPVNRISNTSFPDRRASSSSLTANRNATNVNQEQIVEKAKQEAYVMQRISELQREGLWTEKRLPKQQEPVRCKVHWDYLLEEMVWLATDYAQERKWKKKAAKMCARMVQKHFQDKAIAAQKAEKAEEQHRRRLSAFISKEIKLFWSNAQKIVEFKQKTRLDETRKRALNQHLSFIVDQTEMYSKSLAKGMNQTANSGGISESLRGNSLSDDEFVPLDADESDDETTIAREEKDIGKTAVSDEVAALQRESELDLEDVLNTLPSEYFARRDQDFHNSDASEADEESDAENEDKSDSDSDFNYSEKDSVDCEDTIAAEENTEEKEGKEDPNVEIDMLKDDAEMDINELRRKYGMPPPIKQAPTSSRREAIKEPESEVRTSDEEVSDIDSESEISTAEDEDVGLKSILPKDDSTNGENDDELMDNVAALAQSIQPRGNTLSSTNVVTPVPFLLKHTLREYQHIGLDWLVTMFDRKLNGILADEMGLGKTIQTIALLAHLACAKENWGPHLIIVPTSVMLNWEMEIKKWCPGFKILTYYGSQKERKMKRTGWTKPDAFHICITSYKLVIQDHQSFRRKKWKYMILDEAQNIKNFKSQRWQMLLNFQTQQRLLLTGTPLQNNLMELWSLMHFLMPNVFQSHREFKEWFSNPVSGMIEGNNEYNEGIIKRLHKVLRPFLLRRLKCEVEKQMPRKFEHVVMCHLSKRQRFLYDDFMCRAKTKETLASGNLLSVINVLMQLRKVCNHPNLFEVRPTVSPFQMDALHYRIPSLVYGMTEYNPFMQIDLSSMNMLLCDNEISFSAFMAHRMQRLCAPRRLIEEVDMTQSLVKNLTPPSTPFRLFYRILHDTHKVRRMMASPVAVGTSPAIKSSQDSKGTVGLTDKTVTVKEEPTNTIGIAAAVKQSKRKNAGNIYNNIIRGVVKLSQHSRENISNSLTDTVSQESKHATILTAALVQQIRQNQTVLGSNKKHSRSSKHSKRKRSEPHGEFYHNERESLQKQRQRHKIHWLHKINQRRCQSYPIYGEDLQMAFDVFRQPNTIFGTASTTSKVTRRNNWLCDGYVNCLTAATDVCATMLKSCIKSIEDRARDIAEYSHSFVLFVPPAKARTPELHVSHPPPSKLNSERQVSSRLESFISGQKSILHAIESAMTTQFPEARLIQYDCGKLQTLDVLLRRLKRENHRVLIFTQMTRMLDVLEAFLNFHGHIYLRLDGTTKVDQRQILMERFNSDARIFAFILSTRSGGVGINLTGADTVVFYDSDWNPTMDAQAQDRCHRIGQTKDVHIYRLVSEKTIEENILKKANQKRLLGDLAIEGGNFTTAYFKSQHTIQDLFSVDSNVDDASQRMAEILEQGKARMDKLSKSDVPNLDKSAAGALESAMGACEDDQDAVAARTATAEASADLEEFDETIPIGGDADDAVGGTPLSKAESEVQRLLQQLNPLEKYAMNFLEKHDGGSFSVEQLALAEAEIEEKRLEWEKNRLEALRQEQIELEKQNSQEAPEDSLQLTYSREDAVNQRWMDERTLVHMPLWSPPTPPQDDNDIYIDQSLQLLYDITSVMTESQLPPVYIKRELKRARAPNDAALPVEGRRPIKFQRKDESLTAFPRSLFDRPSPALTRMRRDMKIQKIRGVPGVGIRIPSGANQSSSALQPSINKPLTNIQSKHPVAESEGILEWLIYEDWALLQAIQHYQGLPLNLVVLTPGHTPNWDLVSDLVNNVSRVYRSPKQCRSRYESVIVPREEGKLPYETPKKQKKNKGAIKQPGAINAITGTSQSHGRQSRSPRTSQLYAQDNHASFVQLHRLRVENIKNVTTRKQATAKSLVAGNALKNPKHTAVLSEFGINYDNPLKPEEVAQRRLERIAKEKQKQSCQTSAQTQDLLRQHTISKIVAAAANQQQNLQQSQQQVLLGVPQNQQQQVTAAQALQLATAATGATKVVVSAGNHQATPIIIHQPTASSQIGSQTVTVVSNVLAGTTASTLRAQRIVTPSNLQEALRQRVISQTPTVVTNLSQAQLQARLQSQLQQQAIAVVSKGVTSTVGTTRNLSPTQLLLYKQRVINQQQRLSTQAQHLGTLVPGTAIIQGTSQSLAGVVQHGQKVSLASIGNLNTITVASASGVHSVQVTQPRNQLIKQVGGVKQAITRQISDAEMALLLKKQQILTQQKAGHAIFAPTALQVHQAGTSGQANQAAGPQVATLQVKTAGLTTQNLGQAKVIGGTGAGNTVKANAQQFKQLQHIQAAIQQQQQRKNIANIASQKSVSAQLTQVGNKTGISTTHLIVQSPKTLPGVTMQQINQVIGRGQGPVLLSKSSTRVLPANRQTIQVVSAASATQSLNNLQRSTIGNIQQTGQTVKAQAGQTVNTTRQALFSQMPLAGQPVSVAVRQNTSAQQQQQQSTSQQQQQGHQQK